MNETTLRDGRYVIVGALGEGSQGTTWDAVDKREGRAVAIKRFDVRGARAWKDVELAEREARVLATLSHPKLPRYFDHFEEDGVLYLVMQKIEGTPLSVLRKKGGLREADVVRLLLDADDVLAYLHGRAPPVVHRDLKPSNVIQRPDGSFAFVDFGAVRDRMRPEGGSTVVGTFGYMAPEQFQGRAGPGSDVYAIGATALALLTGEEPEKLPHRGLAIDVDAALAGRASKRLRDALAKMLEPDPDQRPTRIAPLLAGIDAAADDAPSPRSRGGRRSKREERRAHKRAERAQRRSRRREMGVPWPVRIVLALALTAAQIAVVLALRVAVPIVLTLLSLVFGRTLRDAARAVSNAGDRAGSAIGRARGLLDGRRSSAPDIGVRVVASDEAAPRVVVVEPGKRVAIDDDADDDEESEDDAKRPAHLKR
jgi:hypothetical protein